MNMKPGVNTVDFSPYVQEIITNKVVRHNSYPGIYGVQEVKLSNCHQALKIRNLIPASLVSLLVSHIRGFDWLPVGDTGFADKSYDEIGSYRLSNFNPSWAAILWQQFQNAGLLIQSREFNWYDKTDAFDDTTVINNVVQKPVWEPTGINPLFRFIRYKDKGKLVAHYDAPYVQDSENRSLMSLVIYLTPGNSDDTRGSTRFVKDSQLWTPVDKMNFDDWDRCADPSEVLEYVNPTMGDALLFDHRLLHDSEPLDSTDREKIIIRTDIMFRRIT